MTHAAVLIFFTDDAMQVAKRQNYVDLGDVQKSVIDAAAVELDYVLGDDGCDVETADRICCFNRHYAEHKGYAKGTRWLETVDPTAVTTYYDSVSGKPLFRAPIGTPAPT